MMDLCEVRLLFAKTHSKIITGIDITLYEYIPSHVKDGLSYLIDYGGHKNRDLSYPVSHSLLPLYTGMSVCSNIHHV